MCIHIPRIDVNFQPHAFNFKVHRRQIPLALSCATTFNGCQGLTVQKLMPDLRRPVFSHGQLYSAMSRVPAADSVLILKEPLLWIIRLFSICHSVLLICAAPRAERIYLYRVKERHHRTHLRALSKAAEPTAHEDFELR
jgi:hypothetical protein